VFVASEIIHGQKGKPGLMEQYPWLIAFAFGLLHGLGFAGALTEIGLPRQAIATALIFFNLGVEIGQLLFISIAVSMFAAVQKIMQGITVRQVSWPKALVSYAIGSIAFFWVVQRIAAFS
jgi:hypothetical protein